MREECPRCNQGELFAATIKASGEKVVVCGECEALWTAEQKVSATGFEDLVAFLRARALGGGWDALVIEGEGG